MMTRRGEGRCVRKTAETDVEVYLRIYGSGDCEIDTPIRFLNHMIATFARHGFFDIRLRASGDLAHHIVEDVGIALGRAFADAMGGADERVSVRRFGHAIVPMDDAIAMCAVDVGGISERSFVVLRVKFAHHTIEDTATEDITHFIRSFAENAKFTIHIHAGGENEHHKTEAIFKALAIALDLATQKRR
ncbi:MAG: hypothetical protein OCU22_07095 [Canidatus Methanoxibalbensis ujae]|nr:hypothetical protein [Candidatus Methanoxibalbensis ujae]